VATTVRVARSWANPRDAPYTANARVCWRGSGSHPFATRSTGIVGGNGKKNGDNEERGRARSQTPPPTPAGGPPGETRLRGRATQRVWGACLGVPPTHARTRLGSGRGGGAAQGGGDQSRLVLTVLWKVPLQGWCCCSRSWREASRESCPPSKGGNSPQTGDCSRDCRATGRNATERSLMSKKSTNCELPGSTQIYSEVHVN